MSSETSKQRSMSLSYYDALREAAIIRAEFEQRMLQVARSISGKLTAEFGDEITVTYDLGPVIHTAPQSNQEGRDDG